ncbi:MAG: dienelactone hydrolase family protein [Pseudomonadota bacterium]
MCHGAAVSVFPEAHLGEVYDGDIYGYQYGDPSASKHIAIFPDIYGANPLYQGLALRFAEKGARATLLDPYTPLGELPEPTREHAFARRMKLRDKTYLDQVEAYSEKEGVTGIVGFCLGGLYIFELARRAAKPDLVGLYGFPQGLPNDDGIPVPFDYLTSVTRSFTMLMGRLDEPVTTEVMDKLSAMAPDCPAMDLTMYPNAGHGFIADLDSDDPEARAVAEDALARLDAALL